MSAADSKSKVCEFCRGYNVERQWCHVCGGSGVMPVVQYPMPWDKAKPLPWTAKRAQGTGDANG